MENNVERNVETRKTAIETLEEKHECLRNYKIKLVDEIDAWKKKIDKEMRQAEFAEKKALYVIKLPRSKSLMRDWEDNVVKPRDVMNKIVQKFLEQIESENQTRAKLFEENTVRLAELKKILAAKKRQQEMLLALLKAESMEELLAQKKIWEDLKKQEEERLVLLKEKLERLELREKLLKDSES